MMMMMMMTYRAESPGKLKKFNPLCLLHEEHPGAEHNFIFPIYPARNNTKIITQSQYTWNFLGFY
jgi:hypothetical protein